MEVGIIGLPQVGKKTIFRLLTAVETEKMDAEKTKAPLKGVVEVKDPRFDKIVSIYSPEKKTPAHITVVLMPKIDKDYIRSGEFYEHLEDSDALCHIVRSFEDDAIYHIDGTVDAARDIASINAELILADLVFIEKRLERLDKDLKKKQDKEEHKERELLDRFKGQLEKELPLRLLELSDEDRKIISSYPFLTLKPIIIALNVAEGDIAKDVLPAEFLEKYLKEGSYFMQTSAKIESELASIEADNEREQFLKVLGIEESSIDKMTRLLYEALGLISFFTTANKEVRAWTIKKGSTAPQAAGAIHTDMERGFIRAEVIKYDDLLALGDEHKVKEAGKLMVKGKDYIVCDGDILQIRFNV
ncbi:MAG: redox-regulated ATPase YchF [Candidatus Omnitrophica bacterium]|nr:redox-regulated ATPase YchF [Candidatus Omnitrophota bacterium]